MMLGLSFSLLPLEGAAVLRADRPVFFFDCALDVDFMRQTSFE